MLFYVRDGREKDGGRRADDFMLHAWTMQKGATSCRVPRDARKGGEGGALKGAATSCHAPYPRAMHKSVGGDKLLTSCCVLGRGHEARRQRR
jgi:hypothetical protein